MPLCAVHIHAQHGHAQAIPQRHTPCVPRDRPVWFIPFTEYSVYRRRYLAQGLKSQVAGITLRGGCWRPS